MTTAIIQARMGATRLPGKVLKEVLGKTLLEHLLLRLKQSRLIDEIIVATTVSPGDDNIESLVDSLGFKVYRGSEQDVLDRYYQAAKKYKAETVIRITADCPLMDPNIVDLIVKKFLDSNGEYEYVSNVMPPTFPDGMDVEIFSFEALEKSWRQATLPSEREHVTQYIRKNPQTFKRFNVVNDSDLSNFRLTVDEPRDFELVKIVLEKLFPINAGFTLSDIMNLLEANPGLAVLNSDIERDAGLKKSLKEDEQYLSNTSVGK